MVNVALFGKGKVGSILIDKIDENKNINLVSVSGKSKQVFLDDKRPDLIIEAISDVESARSIVLKAIKHGQDIITCNKELIHIYRDELFKKALDSGVKIYLNSIVSGASTDEFPEPLNNINFNQYISMKPFIFRGGGPEETADSMYQDILRYIWDKAELV